MFVCFHCILDGKAFVYIKANIYPVQLIPNLRADIKCPLIIPRMSLLLPLTLFMRFIASKIANAEELIPGDTLFSRFLTRDALFFFHMVPLQVVTAHGGGPKNCSKKVPYVQMSTIGN